MYDPLAALSADEGRTWSPIVKTPTILETFAKTWGQRTKDGRYALVYPHALNRRNRFPMVVMTGSGQKRGGREIAIRKSAWAFSAARRSGVNRPASMPRYISATGKSLPPRRNAAQSTSEVRLVQASRSISRSLGSNDAKRV